MMRTVDFLLFATAVLVNHVAVARLSSTKDGEAGALSFEDNRYWNIFVTSERKMSMPGGQCCDPFLEPNDPIMTPPNFEAPAFCFEGWICCSTDGQWTCNIGDDNECNEAKNPGDACELPPCPADVKQCSENVFVGRDPSHDCQFYPCPGQSKALLANDFDGEPGFYHGVASGDPLSDSVIIWTRYTPVSADDEILLEFRIAVADRDNIDEGLLDPSANPNLRRGTVLVTKTTDWIAKIDVTGLPSNSHFVYVFTDGSRTSDVGMTRTAPAEGDEADELRYAVFSCAHLNNGYFHAYDAASTIKKLDIWLHVGDYAYEYGTWYPYARDAPERGEQILPQWEVVDLQDYRLRQASYLHSDEGHRNLRRTAPLIASWDDHDTADNSWVDGAINHQPVCPADRLDPAIEKWKYSCDQDEGRVENRWTAAAQAYLEWLPIRHMPGAMGNIDIGTLNRVFEWGDLATIVSVDTRTSYRSEEPTIEAASAISTFGEFGSKFTNITAYSDPESEAYAELQVLADEERAIRNDPKFTMVGDNVDVIKEAFRASKEAGKPWQIWAANTMMGPNVIPDPSTTYQYADGPVAQAALKAYLDVLYSTDVGFLARAATAMALENIEFNRDDFGGFANERREILEFAKEFANNMVVLGGDLHDSYAWILYEGGNATAGTPVAVNIGCPGVTSPGFGPYMRGLLLPILDVLGGDGAANDIFSAAWESENDGLVFADFEFKGFYAVQLTKESHKAEYFGIDHESILSDYDAAREASGGITAESTCLTSLVTSASEPGSLERNDICTLVGELESTRPAFWDLPVPTGSSPPNVVPLMNCGFMGCTHDA